MSVACNTVITVSWCRSLVLHGLDTSDAGCKISCLSRISTTGTIYDVAVDRPMNIAVTVGEVRMKDGESAFS